VDLVGFEVLVEAELLGLASVDGGLEEFDEPKRRDLRRTRSPAETVFEPVRLVVDVARRFARSGALVENVDRRFERIADEFRLPVGFPPPLDDVRGRPRAERQREVIGARVVVVHEPAHRYGVLRGPC